MKTKTSILLAIPISAVLLMTLFLLLSGLKGADFKFSDWLDKLLQRAVSFTTTHPEERVYVQTDKPFYKPGEDIWFSAYIRNGKDMTATDHSGILHVELINPKGNVEKKHQLIIKNGKALGDFTIHEEAAGGLYKLKAYTQWQLNDPEPAVFEKEIQVQAVVLPRLKMKLDFERETYGPGAEVAAELDLQTNANKALAHYDFSYTIQLQGAQIHQGVGKTDKGGKTNIIFNLPEELQTNDGLINIMIDYQGQTESISRSVPIVLNQIDLEFYPEGGELVDGLKGKVAFKALNEFGKPADIEGVVLDNKGNEVARFSSFHMGMGAFDFTPAPGQRYEAKITQPEGIEKSYPLPQPLLKGYGLNVEEIGKNKVKLRVSASVTETLSLIAQVRGVTQYVKQIPIDNESQSITIPLDKFPIGVAQFTLFDAKGIARCERLAFVNKHRQLNIDIQTNKEQYLPRELVEIDIAVTDKRGIPMPAQLSLSVADDQLLSFADDKSSNMLSWMLMESDIRGEVEEPNFYFDPEEEKADQALDYLMLTAGWRRFSWQDIRSHPGPGISHPMERGSISGMVLDVDGTPIANILVTTSDSTVSIYTDDHGRFVLKGVDMYEPVSLIAHSPEGFVTKEYRVNDYGEFQQMYLRRGISGIVRDQAGNKLLGATIRVNGTNIGAVTDTAGQFFLNASGNETITISHLGYSSMHLQVTDKSQLDVVMIPNDVTLDEVVVTGSPVVQEKRVLGFAVSSVEASKAKPKRRRAAKQREEINKIPQPVVRIRGNASIQPPVPQNEDNILPAPAVEERERLAREKSDNNLPSDRKAFKPAPEKDLKPESSIAAGEAVQDAPNLGFEDIDADEEEWIDDLVQEVEAEDIPEIMADAEPRIDEFVSVEEEPQPININQLKQQIGYPEIARDAGIQGQVVVRVLVDKQGKYVKHQVVNQVHPLLSEAVEEHIEKLRFTPAIQAGRPMKFWVNMPFNFNLLDGGLKIENIASSRPQGAFKAKYYRAREYAAPDYSQDQNPVERTDFRSTIFWDGDVITGNNGRAKVSFYTSDAITSFNVTIEGIATDGSMGRATHKFFSQLPFSLNTKMPSQLIQEDQLQLPIALINNTNETISGDLSFQLPPGIAGMEKLPSKVKIKANEALSLFVSLCVNDPQVVGNINVGFSSKGFSDAVSQEIKTIPRGFPQAIAFSGEEKKASYKMNLANTVEGSAHISLVAFPNALNEVLSGLEGMLREPYGCFEQTSSTTYPNILVLNYLKETDQAKPEIRKKALGLIKKGYNRLTTFESKGGGFEWFGGNPAHEGLTAYGLMEFVDMNKVYSGVSNELINRTAAWLMSRRDGDGGFQRNPRALHQFGLTDQETMSIYITYALSEAGYQGMDREVDKSVKVAMQTKSPYQLGLVANMLYNTGQKSLADKVLATLMGRDDEKVWEHNGKRISAPGSGGQAMSIETASLALMAMIRSGDNSYRKDIAKTAEYIRSKRSAYGNFGNTHSTVLALRALIAHAQASKKTDKAGSIEILLNGKKIATQAFEAGEEEPIVIAGLEKFVDVEDPTFDVRFAGIDEALPYTLSMNRYTRLPQSQDSCALRLDAQLSKTQLKMGETTRLTATLSNTLDQGQPMSIAILGIPAGLSPQPWQLKELTEQNKVDFYEIRGNELILYYRQMEPSEEKVVNLDLKADLPGSFEASASRAYLYYTDEYKHWIKLPKVVVIP